jgi:hypothetical protein
MGEIGTAFPKTWSARLFLVRRGTCVWLEMIFLDLPLAWKVYAFYAIMKENYPLSEDR